MALEHRKHHPHFPDGMTEAGKGLDLTSDCVMPSKGTTEDEMAG